MNKYLKYILKTMCDFVGANLGDIDFKSEDWYLQYSWSAEKEKEFILWLANYLYNNKEAREHICEVPIKNKKHLKKVAQMFVFNYGWKLDS